MKISRRKTAFFLIFACLLITSAAYSQPSAPSVERATRQTDLFKPQQKIEQELKKGPTKAPEILPIKEPIKMGERKFFVKRIELTGCESFPVQEFYPITAKYENREITITELQNLADEIERDYLKRGIIAAVVIPAQGIKEQTVMLRVVEAKMGELKIGEGKFFRKKRLEYYWKIPQGTVMHYDMISRSVQMMNKDPDRQVKITLAAGQKPGTTDVILAPETHFPVHLVSSFDKEGVVATGVSRTGIGMRDNNFLGFDDSLFAGYTSGTHFNGYYVFHSLPVTPNGASLLYGYSHSKSVPKKEFDPFGIESTADITSLALHQDLYKKDKNLGEAYLGFEANDKTTVTTEGTYSRDRLRIFKGGGTLNFRQTGSITSISPSISQGVDAFGASSRGNPLASRGAKSDFTMFNFNLQHNRALPLNLQLGYKLQLQTCDTKLTPQEEFSLGGIDSVRGYPAGDYLADSAVLNSVELLAPSLFIPKNWKLPYSLDTLRDETTFVAFLDYGHGNRRGHLENEYKSRDLVGVGAGLRFHLFNQFSLRLEWGFPVGDRPITVAGRSYFHFSVDLQEKMPQTVEKIKSQAGTRNL